MAVLDEILRDLSGIDLHFLRQKIYGIAFLKQGTTLVFLISENTLNSAGLPSLFPGWSRDALGGQCLCNVTCGFSCHIKAVNPAYNFRLLRHNDGYPNFFVYFPLSEISERLSCGHDKATGLLKELADAGLIRRIRQKPGCPYKLVVLPFDSYPAKPDTSLRGNRKSKSDFQESEPCEKSAGNKTEDNNPDMNKPDLTYAYQRDAVETQIKQNIYYDILKQDLPVTQLDGIVSLMVDTICTTGNTVKISGESKPRKEVCRRFLALNDIHIRYVFDRTKEESNVVQHPRGYLLARLYEAEDVMDTYYQIRVNHDMNTVNC